MGKGSRQKREQEKKTAAGGRASQMPDLLSGRIYPALAGIFLLGLVLRLFDLARKPLWLDEASTYYLTTQPDLSAVISAASADNHAPLHFITIWLARVAGSSEIFLRLPSALAGAFTVIVIYFIAKELYDERAGLIAASLLAVAPFHILYSQEARMYGMAVLFVSLAIYLFFRSIRTGSLPDWALFGASCALAFYTHFYTAFVIAALIAGYFVFRFREFLPGKQGDDQKPRFLSVPGDLRNFLAGLALSFVLVIPVLASFFSQSGYFISGSFNWGLSMWDIPSQTFLSFSSNWSSALSPFLSVILIILMVFGLVLIWKRKEETALTLLVVFFVPLLISMYLSQIIPFNVRYHLYLIVIFLALAAISLAWLSGKISVRYGSIAVIGLIFLVYAAPLASYYSEPYLDWRSTSSALDDVTRPGDAIVPLPWNNYLPLSYYYNNETDGTHYRNFELTESGFKELDNEKGDVYFVITLGDLSAKGQPAYLTSVAYLNNQTTIISGRSMYDILIARRNA